MIEARVTGVEDLRKELAGLVPKLRQRAIRQALAAGARLVRNAAQRATPLLSQSDPAVQRGYRKPGTVRKAISVRTSKLARKRGDVGVFVNVKPAKGNTYTKSTTRTLFGGKRTKYTLKKLGNRGPKNPNDPFYWRFLQFGWNPASGPNRFSRLAKRDRRRLNNSGAAPRKSGVKFLEAGAAQLGAALAVIMPKLQAAIAKLNKPKAPAP